MKRYVALDGRGRSIVTVAADDEQGAAERIREQLDRPGRRVYLNRWRDGGERIAEKPATSEPETRKGGSR